MMLPAPELELRQLRAFLVVAETRHFGRAAERLGISQPPLSQQIRRLEDRVGHPLFERHARGVALTAAGRELLPAARAALDQVSSGLDAARRAGLGQTGRLRVGFAASLAFTLLPKVIGAYRARFPGVTLDLRELTSTPQLEALRAGTLDAGFVREAPSEPDLVSVPVLHERLVAVLPRAHPLAAEREVPVAALAKEPFVLFPPAEGPAFHARILRVCADAGFTPHIAQQAVEWQTLVAFVEAGLGVTIAPAGVARIRLRGVAFRRLSPDPDPCAVTLCRPAGEPGPQLSAFVAAVVSSAGPPGGRG